MIFTLVCEGPLAPKEALESYQSSRRGYYYRLKRLVDLGLIVEDPEMGIYKHTPVGAFLYQNWVIPLRRIFVANNRLQVLDKLRQKNTPSKGLSSAISDLSSQVLREMETSIGLSNLKPIRLFKTMHDYDTHVATCASKAKSELYLATRNLDLGTLESALRSARRGGRINMVYAGWRGFDEDAPTTYDSSVTRNTPLPSAAARELQAFPNASVHRANMIPYGFLVADNLEVAIEIANPEDSHSFFAGVGLQSSAIAAKLIPFYVEIARRSESNGLE